MFGCSSSVGIGLGVVVCVGVSMYFNRAVVGVGELLGVGIWTFS